VELKDVLAEVPGMHRQFVYYLESQGYIRPLKVQRARIARRSYRTEDLRVLREMWKYYQRGFSVQTAYQLFSRRERLATYVMFPVARQARAQAFEAIIRQASVAEVCAVYGSSFDFIVRTDTPEESDVYYSLLPALAGIGLVGPATVLKANSAFQRPHRHKEARRTMIAYVFMKVPGKDIEDVMHQLQEMAEVVEAAAVYGETDIVVKVETQDQTALDSLVMDRLHQLEKVESTRTFIVIGGSHWQRPRDD
jgi:DNA-binding Lrp family transcriptional regulator